MPVITPFDGDPPSRSDPTNFAARGDALMAWIVNSFVPQANALATYFGLVTSTPPALAQAVVNTARWDFFTPAATGAGFYLVLINSVTAGQDVGMLAVVWLDASSNIHRHEIFASAGLALGEVVSGTVCVTNTTGSTQSLQAKVIPLLP
jgi:hypothetical protein